MSKDHNSPNSIAREEAQKPSRMQPFYAAAQGTGQNAAQIAFEPTDPQPLSPEEAAENAQVAANLIVEGQELLERYNVPPMEFGQYNAANDFDDEPDYRAIDENPPLVDELNQIITIADKAGFTPAQTEKILTSICQFPTIHRNTLIPHLKGLEGQEAGQFLHTLSNAEEIVNAGLEQMGADADPENPDVSGNDPYASLPEEARNNPAAQEFIREMRHTKKPGHLHKPHFCPLPLLLLMAATTSSVTYAAHQVKDLGKGILVELQNSYGAKKGDWEVVISLYDNINRFLFLFLDGGNKAMQTWLENTATHCRTENGHVSEADWKTINSWKREGDKYFDETLKGAGTKAKRGDVPRIAEHEDIKRMDSIAFDHSNEDGLGIGGGNDGAAAGR